MSLFALGLVSGVLLAGLVVFLVMLFTKPKA